ncbi:methyltransferase domain-containing protein, partial [bacterium]|nr:methyltransferase domain-containing protein [bacterium]
MNWTPQNPETVQAIFRSISRSYDLANRVLSLGLDQGWRKSAVKEAILASSGTSSVLDLATGTGDLAIAFRGHLGAAARIVGADFSSEMLLMARNKDPSIEWLHADAISLPFENDSFDIATIS